MKNLDWQILSTLYVKKSITKTAEALYLTQPALTKRIKAIEQEWQVKVVIRTSKGVVFTEEGKYLAKKADIMLDFLDEIRTHFSSGRQSQELLRIGVPNSFARLHMPMLVSSYIKEHDKIQFKTTPNSSDILIQQLCDGSLDIAIVCGDYTYLGEKICLMEEALYMVTPKGMRLDDAEGLPLIESFLNPVVKKLIDQWWRQHFGSLPHGSHAVPFFDIAIEMVDKGLGVCFVFGSDWQINEERLQMIPILDRHQQQLTRRVWMMIDERCFKNQDIMDFVTYVEKYYHLD